MSCCVPSTMFDVHNRFLVTTHRLFVQIDYRAIKDGASAEPRTSIEVFLPLHEDLLVGISTKTVSRMADKQRCCCCCCHTFATIDERVGLPAIGLGSLTEPFKCRTVCQHPAGRGRLARETARDWKVEEAVEVRDTLLDGRQLGRSRRGSAPH